MVNQKLKHLTKTKSNSTTTGTVSMPLADMWFIGTSAFQDALQESSIFSVGNEVDVRVRAYSRAVSRAYISEMASMTERRPALSAQSRVSRVVTKVPKLAVWLLVSANILFMLHGIVFAGLAVVATSPSVYQLALRLNITGLTALGFEGAFALNKAKESRDLFEEHGGGAETAV